MRNAASPVHLDSRRQSASSTWTVAFLASRAGPARTGGALAGRQVLFRFLQGEGVVPLTGTASPAHMRQDLDAAALPLPPHRAAAIRALLA